MPRVLTAGNGWKTIVALVLAYEALCVEEELLSRGMDRLLDRHPVWPRVLVVIVAAHVANLIPERFDIFAMAVHKSRLGGRGNLLTGRMVSNCKNAKLKIVKNL